MICMRCVWEVKKNSSIRITTVSVSVIHSLVLMHRGTGGRFIRFACKKENEGICRWGGRNNGVTVMIEKREKCSNFARWTFLVPDFGRKQIWYSNFQLLSTFNTLDDFFFFQIVTWKNHVIVTCLAIINKNLPKNVKYPFDKIISF